MSPANRNQGSNSYQHCIAQNKHLWQITKKYFILLAKVIIHFAQNEITEDTLYLKVGRYVSLFNIFQEQKDYYNKVKGAYNSIHINLLPNFYYVWNHLGKKEIDHVPYLDFGLPKTNADLKSNLCSQSGKENLCTVE